MPAFSIRLLCPKYEENCIRTATALYVKIPHTDSTSIMSTTEGKLCITHLNGVNTLTECVFSYPLRLSQQEKWLKHVSIIACGFGGGYVEGDRVTTSITVEEDAQAW